MNGAVSMISKNLNHLDNSHNYYILIPHKEIAKGFLKLYAFMFILYLFSFNTIMTALLTPVYVLMLYTFYYYYKLLKSHGYKLFSYIIVTFVCNIPFGVSGYYIRTFIYFLLKEGDLVWISTLFQ